MLLMSAVYLILLFILIVVPLSSFCVFLSLCVASDILALVFLPGLYSAAYMTAFFLHSLLTGMFFSPYAYYVAAFCYFPLFLILSVFLFLVFFCFNFLIFVSCVPSWRRCPLLATFLPVSFCLLSLFFVSPNVFPV